MGGILEWTREHRWETVSAVLGLALVVALVFLFTGGDDDPAATAASTTTSTLDSSTTAPTSATTEDDSTQATGTTSAGGPEGVTAIVVDNVADVGFQIGLNQADLLVETPVEGGLSRFTALYGTEVPQIVGPVRSLRPVSADLLAPFHPVVFATGGQPFVLGAVEGAGATIVTPDESIAFQSLERPQPHHVFVSPETEAHEGADLIVPWEEGEWPGGEPATEITLSLAGGVTWRFENDVYVRYRDDAPHEVLSQVDADPEPLTRETLILLVASEKSAGYTDGNGVDVPTFDIVGGGRLLVLHRGELLEGTWFRAAQSTGYSFTMQDSETILIPPGSTYVAILPNGQEIALGG